MNIQSRNFLFKCKEPVCQSISEINSAEFQKLYKSSLTVLNICALYEYFKCEKINCEGTHYEIYFPRNALVLDSENIQLCKQCNNPISEVRKTLLPKTNICSARCIEEGKIKDDSIYKEHIKPLTIKDKCPRHNEILVERYDRFGGLFYGCPKYPFCFYTKSNLSELEETKTEKINLKTQKIKPIIHPPKLEKRIWGSALSLTKQAKELYNKKNFNELLNIKNELEYRVNKRKKFQQPPWKPTNEALEYVINLLGKNN